MKMRKLCGEILCEFMSKLHVRFFMVEGLSSGIKSVRQTIPELVVVETAIHELVYIQEKLVVIILELAKHKTASLS
jgi:hypothetical protein